MTDEQLAEAKKARAEKSNRAQLAELLERMTVKELFDLYDKDKSGYIDYEEFSEMLPQSALPTSEEHRENNSRLYTFYL